LSDVQMFCGVAYPGCVIVPITEVFFRHRTEEQRAEQWWENASKNGVQEQDFEGETLTKYIDAVSARFFLKLT